MAHIKKKFTFDNPEDSYWNESGSNSSSLFDDLPSKQWAARAAVDNLFEVREVFSAKIPQLPNNSPTTANSIGATVLKKEARREEAVDDFINHKTANFKIETESSPLHAGGPSAASVVSECSVSSLPSDANRLDLDYSRLKAEHHNSVLDSVSKSLRNFFLTAHRLQKRTAFSRDCPNSSAAASKAVRHDRYRAPDVREAVRRLLKGDPVSLEWYRSKEEKAQLLDAAIDIVDSNVILAVVLFLKNTLMDSLFRDLLLRRSQAAEEYIAYLKVTRDHEELTTTLFALGRNADAAMVEFSAALRHQVPDQKVKLVLAWHFDREVFVSLRKYRHFQVQALKKCARSGFSDPQLAAEAAVVNDYVSLLERQMPINVGKSVIATYYYCCLYHYDVPVHSLANPVGIRESFRITDKEAVWTSVSALAKQSRWPDVERVLQPKTLLGALQSRATLNSPKLSCPFSWQNLFHILYINSAAPPKDLSCRILRAVSDADQRLKLAEKYDVCEIVIECLVAQRDRLRLSKYANKLTPNTPDAYKAMAALNNTVSRR
ncbi:unnamed protein product [Heligmosomoides polygyrus]|uniref:Vps16_C domain-containing protein n=1 Tax=Heligmosomoides polygyrus TaxID=6339 RepID=A0A3P7TBP4_HELPZ|nr:unnamed protein product [Heligmosomoides polygyrus]